MSWTKVSNNVKLSPELIAKLNALSDMLSFDIEITSGIRSAKSQASAMFGKIEAGDNTLSDYRNREFANDIVEAYPNLDTATAIVQEYANQGLASYHLVGKAVDVRSKTLSDVQKNEVVKVAKLLGGKPLIETQPPHIHISFPDLETKKNNWLVLGALIGAILWIFQD